MVSSEGGAGESPHHKLVRAFLSRKVLTPQVTFLVRSDHIPHAPATIPDAHDAVWVDAFGLSCGVRITVWSWSGCSCLEVFV